jgi:hypothetical protein
MARKTVDNSLHKQATLEDLWRMQAQVGLMITEAQAVIALRTLGVMGLWAVRPSENTRMVSEKPTAFIKSAQAAMAAAAGGKRPDQIVTAAVAPIRRRTSSNARRLAHQGPQIGLR